MAEQNEKSWFESVGCRVSALVADVAAHPYAQIGFIVVCVAWFAIGFNINILTAGLSIMAITLTQMVLNNQNEREIEAHRRDIAMHAKLDELIAASRKARNDLVGVEDREEEEIVQLKEEVKEALDAPAIAEPEIRETVKEAVEEALHENGHDASDPAEART
jgi:low affinity Fe/Cu permease